MGFKTYVDYEIKYKTDAKIELLMPCLDK